MKKRIVLVLLSLLLLTMSIAPVLTISAAGNEGPTPQAQKTLTTWRSLGSARITQSLTWNYNYAYITGWRRYRLPENSSTWAFRYWTSTVTTGGNYRSYVTTYSQARFSRYFLAFVVSNWYPWIRQTGYRNGAWSWSTGS